MNPGVTEWEFTADVASWINQILAQNPALPFSRAKCEQRRSGSQQRRDLTLLDRDQARVLTGEVKLPYQEDGGSAYNESVVEDARKKAQRAGVRFFFTWNVNEFVLWETFPAKTARKDRKYKTWDVASVHRPEHMEYPGTERDITVWLPQFLSEFSNILLGEVRIGTQSPDEKFIDMLESALEMPIRLTVEALEAHYAEPTFRSELDKWMRDEQGWTIYDDPEGIRENLVRAAKFACYALVNKLVFREALLKRYGGRLRKMSVQSHINNADELRLALEGFFTEAKEVTRDYETVFGEEHKGIGNRIPFYSHSSVPHWRQLINQIHEFDFTQLDYEVIGRIFEKLIGPEERHKYGQYYTRPEVVDLINSFCIRRGDEAVMDPACGGGTFLVRAYARKRELAPQRAHAELLTDLFGVDVSEFATHLTTINLATRDLVGEENYPRIARSDFFDIEAANVFVTLPSHLKARGLGKGQQKDVRLPPLDAVVGNPPYIRQEDIPAAREKGKDGPEHGTKDYYYQLVTREQQIDLSGRSDIHCYFWPHATAFLKCDGWLCLLTSSQWLDVDYGFRLQDWMLRSFKIVAIFESVEEPWFVGARVTTAVTILQREKDQAARMDNVVRFVQLRKPIGEILAHDGTGAGAVVAADSFRDEILSLTSNTTNERYRARLVRQGDLWKQGVELGALMRGAEQEDNDTNGGKTNEYYGGKWGVYLRAPDIWFELLDKHGERLVPLGKIAEIRRGITSGKDCFFFPVDCSADCLQKYESPLKFEVAYGVPRRVVKSGKVKLVRCGEGRGEVRPMEAEYLAPEIHSLMEIDSFVVTKEQCRRLILLVGEKRSRLKGKYVLDYIKWGEKKGYHKGATCSARVTEGREWYDLTGQETQPVLWPKERQYRHIAPTNPGKIAVNCRLYGVFPPPGCSDPKLWAGILNSSWVLLSSFQFGRPVGNEGNWSTMVVDATMMLVPDPAKAGAPQRRRVVAAFEGLDMRHPLQFLSERRLREMAYRQAHREEELEALPDECELDMPDRRKLDDAVLALIGVESRAERQRLIDLLYRHLRYSFELTRRKEEKAIANKKVARRVGPPRPNEIAAQIYHEISQRRPELLLQYRIDFFDAEKPYDTFDLPDEGTPVARNGSMLCGDHGVSFRKNKTKVVGFVETKIPEQDDLVVLLASAGIRGLVTVPHEPAECQRVYAEFRGFLSRRDQHLRELIQERTADEDMQEGIFEELMPLVARGPEQPSDSVPK